MLGGGTYLYFVFPELLRENESTNPGLFRLLAGGGVILVGLLFLFGATVHWLSEPINQKGNSHEAD